ncbi:50S ribosomal protein L30 [Halococcoides cellulosivorans]|uniref:Large ribosomal subunit protein uL30 n=1 Tax=Halococcoides cellulosivorans TaxID=1679096 RepID=A0A2R4X2H9_9EURY|nr:50S ribosomal protein L30 [Halococcoides cellulosivorans]AWB27923.1 50S ribosomal protein L30 [Halococcoides cellulosivorans]
MEALVQLRGEVDMTGKTQDTLEMLNLGRVNHATVVPETDAYNGMIAVVNDYVAHGEPSADVLGTVIERRGAATEADSVEAALDAAGYDDATAAAEALLDEETTLRDLGLEPTLRLHPPRGGHDGIKQPKQTGGQLGPADTDRMDDLLEAMR